MVKRPERNPIKSQIFLTHDASTKYLKSSFVFFTKKHIAKFYLCPMQLPRNVWKLALFFVKTYRQTLIVTNANSWKPNNAKLQLVALLW